MARPADTSPAPPAPMHEAVVDTTVDLIDVEDRFDEGITWRRTGCTLLEARSHALVDDEGRVWVIDPIDGEILDAELAKLGPIAGVIVLHDRHLRAAPQIAARHSVPLYVPAGQWRRGHDAPDGALDYEQRIPECPFEFLDIVIRDGQWLERALWWPEHRLLAIAEAVGSPSYYRSRRDEPMAVHPILRLLQKPQGLDHLDPVPERILFGHGASATQAAAAQLDLAISETRRELPSYLLTMPRHAIRWARTLVGAKRAGC